MGKDATEVKRKSYREQGEAKRKLAEKRADPLGDLLAEILCFAEACSDEHPSDPPLTITMGPYQDAWYCTVSDKAYRRSVSGFGPSLTTAMERLEERLRLSEIPWKGWGGHPGQEKET